MKAYEGIGASPVPLPFGELYTALQTGVVDGNENGPLTLYGKKFYEVQRYMSMLPVVSNGGIFLMGKATWEKLSREHQLALTKCIPVWRKKMDKDALEKGGWAIQKMKDQGLRVDTVADLTPFIEATKGAYEWLYSALPKDTAGWTREMVSKIRDVGATIKKEQWYVTK